MPILQVTTLRLVELVWGCPEPRSLVGVLVLDKPWGMILKAASGSFLSNLVSTGLGCGQACIVRYYLGDRVAGGGNYWPLLLLGRVCGSGDTQTPSLLPLSLPRPLPSFPLQQFTSFPAPSLPPSSVHSPSSSPASPPNPLPFGSSHSLPSACKTQEGCKGRPCGGVLQTPAVQLHLGTGCAPQS